MKVIVVDDHQLVLEGFTGILTHGSCHIVGSYTDPRKALTAILELKPDVVLTDLDMPHLNGQELITEVRAKIPEQKFVLLTMHLNQQLIKKMMRLKVSADLSKNAHPEELMEAVSA